MAKFLEKNLRDWLRAVWAKSPRRGELGLRWIEPAFGSTVGDPDVLVPLGGRLVPVELKLGRLVPGGSVVPVGVRPAQRRYHHQARKAGIDTAYLVAVVDDEGDYFDVHFVPGDYENRLNPPHAVVSFAEKREPKVNSCLFLTKLEAALAKFYR